MAELTLQASLEKLDEVLAFVEENLEKNDCPMKVLMQVQIAVEEIFVNIAHYAYDSEQGTVTIRVEVGKDPLQAIITFIDQGVPYDPLQKEDPDVTLSAEERQIGGLGIFMVKKSMDDMTYEYVNGKNILTICKKI
ncbi:MAG: ATP-binding protein [Eubacteriales bacterium]|nr:ATP-binding protein [Eubacteriales bacterium]